jgi:hypothetical protein
MLNWLFSRDQTRRGPANSERRTYEPRIRGGARPMALKAAPDINEPSSRDLINTEAVATADGHTAVDLKSHLKSS